MHNFWNLFCEWLQYLETLDEMESIDNTPAQQTAISGSSSVDEPTSRSNGAMQYVEAGKPATSSNTPETASTPNPPSSAAKVQPLGYRCATTHVLKLFVSVLQVVPGRLASSLSLLKLAHPAQYCKMIQL